MFQTTNHSRNKPIRVVPLPKEPKKNRKFLVHLGLCRGKKNSSCVGKYSLGTTINVGPWRIVSDFWKPTTVLLEPDISKIHLPPRFSAGAGDPKTLASSLSL
jgi:hypothetical protein